MFSKNKLKNKLNIKKVLKELEDVELQVYIAKSKFYIFKITYFMQIIIIFSI